MTHLYEMSGIDMQIHRNRKIIDSCQELMGWAERGVIFYGNGLSLWDEENILKLDNNDDCITLNKVKTTELRVHFKRVNVMVHELHLSKAVIF